MSDKKLKVTVTGRPVCEDGVHYSKGQTFEVTAVRAKSLGGFVAINESEPHSDTGADEGAEKANDTEQADTDSKSKAKKK